MSKIVQSDVLKYGYECVYNALKELGNKTALFSVQDSVDADSKPPHIFVSVKDLSQILQDKNGEKIYVDKTEFPAPSILAFLVAMRISAQTYAALLEIAGQVIRYFKDNNSFPVGDYNWLGNRLEKLFIEPVIRQPDTRSASHEGAPAVTLEYRVEAGINSLNSIEFTRVKERDIRIKTKEDEGQDKTDETHNSLSLKTRSSN